MTEDPHQTRTFGLRALAWHVGAAFMLMFVISLPAARALTYEANRFYMHFHWSQYLLMLCLMALLAVPAGAVLMALRRPDGRLRPLQRLLIAGVAVLPLTYLVVTATRYLGMYYLTSGLLDRYADLLWGAMLAPLALSEKVFTLGEKIARPILKLIAPLPLVLLLAYYAQTPDYSSVLQPEPAALTEAREGSPVYLLCFDALDRELIFTDENSARYPALSALCNEATWFADARSYGDGTVHVLPCFLYQQRAQVTRAGNGDYLIAGTPAHELESILTALSDSDTTRVVGGFHLNFSFLMRGQYDWLREHPMRNDPGSLSVSARVFVSSSLDTMFAPESLPVAAARAAAGVETIESDVVERILDDLKAQTYACAAGPNKNVVAFFHYPVPHSPFIFDRNGRVNHDAPEISDEAYLRNVEQVDTIVGGVVTRLRESGQWERATIVVFGDHGTTYDRPPPLIVKLPGQTTGRVVEGEFYTADLLAWLRNQPEFTR